MRKLLDQLMELQKIDTQLQQIEALKGDLPNQVRLLNQELAEAEKTLETEEKRNTDTRREAGAIELEIKALEGRQAKYQTQLFEVKTNREYDAVTHEIESVKGEIAKKETRQYELIELADRAVKAIETARETVDRLKGEYEKKKAALGRKQEVTERDEIALLDKRDKALRGVEVKWVSSYQRIRKAKNGLALVPVVRNACGGCRKTLPPQRVLEIRERDRVYLCDVCGRILVWDEKVSETQE